MKRKKSGTSKSKKLSRWSHTAQSPGTVMPTDDHQDTSDTDDDVAQEALREVPEARSLAEQMPHHYQMADVRKGRATRGFNKSKEMPRKVQSPTVLLRPTPLEVSGAYSVGAPASFHDEVRNGMVDARDPYDASLRDDDAPMNEQCLIGSLEDWPQYLQRDAGRTFSVEDRRMAAVETLERSETEELLSEKAKMPECSEEERRLRRRLSTDPMVARGMTADMRERFVDALAEAAEEEAARYEARVLERDGVLYNDSMMPKMSKEDRAYNRPFLRPAVGDEKPCVYNNSCIGRMLLLTPGATADMSIGDRSAQPLRSYYAPHELEAIRAGREEERARPCLLDRRASNTLHDIIIRAAGLAPPSAACDTYADAEEGEYPGEALHPVLRNTYADTEGPDGYAYCECAPMTYGGMTSSRYRTVGFLPNCYQLTEFEVEAPPLQKGQPPRMVKVLGLEEIVPLFGLAPATRPSITAPSHGRLRTK